MRAIGPTTLALVAIAAGTVAAFAGLGTEGVVAFVLPLLGIASSFALTQRGERTLLADPRRAILDRLVRAHGLAGAYLTAVAQTRGSPESRRSRRSRTRLSYELILGALRQLAHRPVA